MAEQAKTLTVDELIAQLMKFPQDTKVYMSSDTEGNGYGTLGAGCFSEEPLDKAIILFPYNERLEYDEICPNESAAEDQD